LHPAFSSELCCHLIYVQIVICGRYSHYEFTMACSHISWCFINAKSFIGASAAYMWATLNCYFIVILWIIMHHTHSSCVFVWDCCIMFRVNSVKSMSQIKLVNMILIFTIIHILLISLLSSAEDGRLFGLFLIVLHTIFLAGIYSGPIYTWEIHTLVFTIKCNVQ